MQEAQAATELVETLLPFVPAGTLVSMVDGTNALLLDDAPPDLARALEVAAAANSGGGGGGGGGRGGSGGRRGRREVAAPMLLVLGDGQLCCAGAEHVSALLPEDAPTTLAEGALEAARQQLPPLPQWTARPDGVLCAAASTASAAVGGALPLLSGDGLGVEPPAAVAKQASRVAWVDEQMAAHELHGETQLQQVLEASKREAKLDEEEGRLRRKLGIMKRADGAEGESEGEGGAVAVDETWQQFQAVCDVLRVYGALEGYAATELGELVGALSGDNELWLALVLMEVAAAPQLSPPQIAAVLAATLDERARPGAYVGFSPSDEVRGVITSEHVPSSLSLTPNPHPHPHPTQVLEMVETLGGRAEALERVQETHGVSFNVGVEPASVGLVEAWAEGVSWPQLMAGTSLDAGDIFRLLKRTVELLRQVRYLVITHIT